MGEYNYLIVLRQKLEPNYARVLDAVTTRVEAERLRNKYENEFYAWMKAWPIVSSRTESTYFEIIEP